MDNAAYLSARPGNRGHLENRDYYVAWIDELEIEARLLGQLDGKVDVNGEGNEEKAMRAALREIDRLKIEGCLVSERARLQKLPEIEGLDRTLDRAISKLIRDDTGFLKNWDNLRQGMNSPDPEQAERFNKFFDAAGLGPKTPREIVDLIGVLEPAKTRKKPGRKPIPVPKWRNDTAVLDEMLALVNRGMSVKAASERIAEEEASGREESRAKRLANFYRDRQKLR